jgi:methionyl aminopeptidase
MSVSVGIGELAENARNLLKFTQNILSKAIKAVVPGVHLGDIGYLIESESKKRGYSVVLDYVGHFIGEEMHEDPNVPNSGNMNEGLILKPGMTFCIEPMINEGSYKVVTRGWDVRTKDGKLSCRFEHTVLVTETGVEILTDMKNV